MVGRFASPSFLEIKLNIESGRCLKFDAKTTRTVNQETEHWWEFAAILAATVFVNMVSAVIVGRQERTGINKMIICDCLFNVLNMGGYFFNMSSWRLLGSSHLCAIWLFFRNTIMAWNNLAPVAIATQRYLLVCRAVAGFLAGVKASHHSNDTESHDRLDLGVSTCICICFTGLPLG